MHKLLADGSRALNRALGGEPGRTLCHRIAMRWGDRCLFCQLIGIVLRDEWHCYDELSPADIIERLKRLK